MNNPTQRGGSGISARTVTPSLQMDKLAAMLAKALQEPSLPQGEMALLSVAGSRVVVNTRGVLGQVFSNPDFSSVFASGQSTGFIRDIDLPPPGTHARVGGRLLAGSQIDTATSINRLVDAIDACIDATVPQPLQAELGAHTVADAIVGIADHFGIKTARQPGHAMIVPVAFAGADRTVASRNADLARLFSVIELVEGADALERFTAGVSNVLLRHGSDDDDVAAVAQSLRSRAVVPGDTIQRFLQFLEDEALARVRLQVSMRLMASLAELSQVAGFKAFVARVGECFERFAGPRGEALHLDVSSVYGQKSNVNLSESLRSAGFYSCLSVWPEWSVQMFEARADPTAATVGTVREVSYRFRVNGINPEYGLPAFDVRLNRHEARLKEIPLGERSLARQVADLVFLWLVVPERIDQPTKTDLVVQAKDIAAQLKANPASVMAMIIDDLRARAPVVTQIANELVKLITDKGHRLLEAAESSADRVRVTISRGVIDMEAFASYSDKTEVLRRSNTSQDNIEWLKHLTVGEDTPVPNSLMSFVVQTRIQERALVPLGPPQPVGAEHEFQGKVLPIRFAPYKLHKASGWMPLPLTDGALDPGFGIEVQYDGATLGKRRDLKDNELASHEQRRAAAISAFTVLAYVTLWLLLRRARSPGLSTMLLRVAMEGKRAEREEDSASPSTTLYAISHALEIALSREGHSKLQGYIASGEESIRDHRQKGSVAALQGGQPLSFKLEGSLDRVAVVTYVTRPCDTHPLSGEPDTFLFICRTYVAQSTGAKATMKVARMRTRVMGDRGDLADAQPVLTELAWLAEQGFEHVLLLSHHFGNRRLGRAADRHAPHGSLEFLDVAHQRFPAMRFYTLRRDVFPATRLRRRATHESAFEVVKFEDHQQLYDRYARDIFRGVMPIYTFATMHVVGQEGRRPQSGFCTYFFDVDHRMADLAWHESTRAHMLGFGGDGSVRQSLICVLRALHFLESERQIASSARHNFLPVLDPFDWSAPVSRAAAGEVEIMSRRRKGEVLLSLPALLSHVTEVLKVRFTEDSP